MIPLFPFFHLPFGSPGLQIDNALGGLINADAHAMEDSYLPAVGTASWADLRLGSALRADQSAQVRGWLERAARGSGSFVMGSARLLTMIGQALAWLAAKAGKLVLAGVSVGLVASFTALDQLAWLLTQAAHLAREVGVFLRGLVGAIFAFLGRTSVQVGEVSAAFLRWLLGLLFTHLSSAALRALRKVL